MDFEEAKELALAFRRARDWEQFHNPKDLAISISIEAAELLEVFQWSGADLEASAKAGHAREELADIAIYCIYMAEALGVDLPQAVADKISDNERKYPIAKAKGSSAKYTEL